MRPSEVLKITGDDVKRGYVGMVSKRNKMRRIYFTDSLRLSLQDDTVGPIAYAGFLFIRYVDVMLFGYENSTWYYRSIV